MEVTITSNQTTILELEEYLQNKLTEKHFKVKNKTIDKLIFLILFRDDELDILKDILEKYPDVDIFGKTSYSYGDNGYQEWKTVIYITTIDDSGKKVLKKDITGGWA